MENGAVFFIFGATGDLAKRKLYPAIYSLYKEKKLSKNFAVIGLARRSRTNEEFREDVLQALKNYCRYEVDEAFFQEEFAQHFEYKSLDIHHLPGFVELSEQTKRLEKEFQVSGNRLFYLAVAPELFGTVSLNLQEGGLLSNEEQTRFIIEKPIGYDLESAKQINEQISKVFSEQQVYRIDHYLGKEMIQNIEAMRFANPFFEAIWNRHYISNVQVTLSETVGVEERGGYYEQAGALRDMGQNHMLQILTLLTMEMPSRFSPEDIRDEKVKVLRSLRKYNSVEEVHKNIVRGQYQSGTVQGKNVSGYKEENFVSSDSNTETYFAARLWIDNARWSGVPFYLRTGKRLPVKTSEIIIEFKNLPEHVYFSQKYTTEPNLLKIKIHPEEGIEFQLNKKTTKSELGTFSLSHYVQEVQTQEAYERLLNDVLQGDSTYFTRWDEVAAAWSFVDEIEKVWKLDVSDLDFYESGTWGPKKSQELLSQWWPIQGQKEYK